VEKPKIKICGITRKEDAILAEKLGAWAIGFIFVKNTPRYILPEKAAEIIKELSGNTLTVGVFMDAPAEEVLNIAEQTGITKIQFHSKESPEFCEILAKSTGKDLIKAISIKNGNDIEKIDSYKGKVSFILLDSWSENESGGTGKVFDWEIAKEAKNKEIPIILAGGINAGSIKQAYEKVKPYAFDISSGVEAGIKGIKDPNKLKTLFSIINPE